MTEQAVHYSAETPEGLVLFDVERRTYLALSSEGDYWHVIRPLRKEDPPVREGTAQVDQLACSCVGGTYHGTCYRLEQAIAWEADRATRADDERWWAPGELQEAFGK